jgi:hypothetical protein
MRTLKQLASSTIAWWLFVVLALILFGVEASNFASPESLVRAFAAWAWLAISCLVLIIAFLHGFLPFVATEFGASRDRAWYLVAFLFPPLLILFDVQGATYTALNTETTQQLAGALDYMHNSRELGIFDLAFLDYPARQYLLPALPSLIFGTGVITLRLGYGILYFIAYFSFLSATWAYLRHWKLKFPFLLASFAGMSISLSAFPLLFARVFEQTITCAATRPWPSTSACASELPSIYAKAASPITASVAVSFLRRLTSINTWKTTADGGRNEICGEAAVMGRASRKQPTT